jgi:hypothetical protein
MKFSVGGQFKHDGKQTVIQYYDAEQDSTEMNDAFYSHAKYHDN